MLTKHQYMDYKFKDLSNVIDDIIKVKTISAYEYGDLNLSDILCYKYDHDTDQILEIIVDYLEKWFKVFDLNPNIDTSGLNPINYKWYLFEDGNILPQADNNFELICYIPGWSQTIKTDYNTLMIGCMTLIVYDFITNYGANFKRAYFYKDFDKLRALGLCASRFNNANYATIID